jgi:hypothetical protein
MTSKMAKATSSKELNAVARKAAAAVEASHSASTGAAQAKTERRARKRANKKIGKKALKGYASQYLALLNPFALTLIDPFRFRGVRVPDLITTPSTVCCLQQTFTVEPGADGNILIMVGTKMANATAVPAWPAGVLRAGLVPLDTSVGVAVDPTSYAIGQVISSSSTTQFDTGVATTVNQGLYWSAWGRNNGVPTIASSGRLVSAAVAVQYTGAPLIASGTYTTVSCSNDVLESLAFDTGMTYARIKALPTATTTALNTMKGVAVRYLPTSAARSDYIKLGTLNNSTAAADGTDVRNHSQTSMLVMINGMGGASSNPVEVTVCANYELLPNTNSLSFVDTGVSHADPVSYSQALNLSQQVSPAYPSAEIAFDSPNAAGSGASAVQPASALTVGATQYPHDDISQMMGNASTMFDTLLTQGAGAVEKATSMIEKYGPVVEGLMASFA